MNRSIPLLVWLASILSGFAQTITTTPTFNNIGVVVTLPSATTQSVVRMFIKPSRALTNSFREIHPLSRLNSTRFAGSALLLDSAANYDFKLVSPAFAANLLFSAATRADVFPDATNTVYHVSPSTGSDSNVGTQRFYRLQHTK